MIRGIAHDERMQILSEYRKKHGSSTLMLSIAEFPLMYDTELKKHYIQLANWYQRSMHPSPELVIKLQYAGAELRARGLDGDIHIGSNNVS